MSTSEQMIAYAIHVKGDTKWIARVVWSRGSPQRTGNTLNCLEQLTHYSGIDFLIRYSIRTMSWTTPRNEHGQVNLCQQNLIRRRMVETQSRDYMTRLKAIASLRRFDGKSWSIPDTWLWQNPFHLNGHNYDEYNRPVVYDTRSRRFVRPAEYGPPTCACGR